MLDLCEKNKVEIEQRETSDERRDTQPVRLGEILPMVLSNIKTRIQPNQQSQKKRQENRKPCESVMLQPRIYV